ncbi:MAG: SpoIIE family protein phosphatase [Candidatus Zixiibacteriota bacterium]|nr:MAG: SpoIIE family protein phosphatase [candidate division Zixibacteria bacterium]
MFKLTGTDGSRFYSWDLVPGIYTIGRKQECDLQVPNQTISRFHAQIEAVADEEHCFITDLGSHNGTAVNGQKISDRVALKIGDVITIGAGEFRLVTEGESLPPTSRPTATRLSEVDPENSVYLSIDEALKPLPSKVTDLPDLFPAFSEMARMLVLHEPLQVMLEKSLQLVARVIPAERLAVLTTSEDKKEVYTTATLLPGGKDPGTFTLSRTIIDDILTEKRAVLVGDPASDPRYAQQQSIIISNLRSAMAVPIFDEGEVHGVLYVDSTNPAHKYSDEYLRLLATFGNIIASRLQNYALAQEREEKRVMDAELKKASLIQKKLLVSECPECRGYSAHVYQDQCRMVGGDLYDMTVLPDGKFLFLVGDVSGKGMGAALLMSNILASFRTLYGEETFDLARAIVQVSKQMFVFSNPGDFATLFVGLIDPLKNQLAYVNAGHNPPMLVSNEGDLRLLEPSGFMIGAFDYGDWQVDTQDLAAGDLVVVFTDGVTEAQRGEELYGEERLERLLIDQRQCPPDQICGKLVEDIVAFVEQTPQSDDITMLLVKRND